MDGTLHNLRSGPSLARHARSMFHLQVNRQRSYIAGQDPNPTRCSFVPAHQLSGSFASSTSGSMRLITDGSLQGPGSPCRIVDVVRRGRPTSRVEVPERDGNVQCMNVVVVRTQDLIEVGTGRAITPTAATTRDRVGKPCAGPSSEAAQQSRT